MHSQVQPAVLGLKVELRTEAPSSLALPLVGHPDTALTTRQCQRHCHFNPCDCHNLLNITGTVIGLKVSISHLITALPMKELPLLLTLPLHCLYSSPFSCSLLAAMQEGTAVLLPHVEAGAEHRLLPLLLHVEDHLERLLARLRRHQLVSAAVQSGAQDIDEDLDTTANNLVPQSGEHCRQEELGQAPAPQAAVGQGGQDGGLGEVLQQQGVLPHQSAQAVHQGPGVQEVGLEEGCQPGAHPVELGLGLHQWSQARQQPGEYLHRRLLQLRGQVELDLPGLEEPDEAGPQLPAGAGPDLPRQGEGPGGQEQCSREIIVY